MASRVSYLSYRLLSLCFPVLLQLLELGFVDDIAGTGVTLVVVRCVSPLMAAGGSLRIAGEGCTTEIVVVQVA